MLKLSNNIHNSHVADPELPQAFFKAPKEGLGEGITYRITLLGMEENRNKTGESSCSFSIFCVERLGT